MHIMLDFETLDTGPFPVLLSIGAVVFDPATNEVPTDPNAAECFFRQISAQSCINRSASVSEATIKWWLSPEREPGRAHILDNKALPVDKILASFIGWATTFAERDSSVVSERCLWSHGLLADVRWLDSYMTSCGYEWPGQLFNYRSMRDTRTVYALAQQKQFFDQVKPKIEHHPLYDCMAQAANLQRAFRVLGL